MPVVPAIAAHINQKREIKTLRASGRHIGPRPAERRDHPAQHADETAPGRKIQKDGRVRCGEPSGKRAPEITVHHPFRPVDECRHLAFPCRRIGLSPARTPIMLIEMYDRKPGDAGDLPGEGRLSGAGTAKDEHPPHRDNLHALSGPAPSGRRKQRSLRPGRPKAHGGSVTPISKTSTATGSNWVQRSERTALAACASWLSLRSGGRAPDTPNAFITFVYSVVCSKVQYAGTESIAIEGAFALFC
jgi:hypothetical protein